MAAHLGGGETTVRGSSGGVGGVVEYCGATTELGVVEGHQFRGRTRLSPVTSSRRWKAVAGSSQGGGGAGRRFAPGTEVSARQRRGAPEDGSNRLESVACRCLEQRSMASRWLSRAIDGECEEEKGFLASASSR
jgi:hypothetical protein